MVKPLVAIVGRPNVGKSTFFNRIAGRRISIVEDIPGVTRDRVYADAEWRGYSFTMVDTGGIEPRSDETMWKNIREQARLAVELADVVLYIVDGKSGILSDDYEVAGLLRSCRKPVILAVNKADNPNDSAVICDFYALGMGEPIPISAEQGLNIGDLLDAIVEKLPVKITSAEEEEALKIAVVGKPNSGKSSLVNRILGFDRVIVTDIAGTTRDAIDTPFTSNGKKYVIIDTAGIRRKNKVNENVEYYGVVRSIDAVRRADVAAVVIDAGVPLSEQDVRICGLVHESRKPSLIIMNKWDLIEKDSFTINKYDERLGEELKFMSYYKPLYISALTGKRTNLVLDSLNEVYNNASKRISTGVLNDALHDAISAYDPPVCNGKKPKIYYGTQVKTNPPTFAFFVNDEAAIHFSYRRYLENALRKAFDFSGTPISIRIKNREREE